MVTTRNSNFDKPKNKNKKRKRSEVIVEPKLNGDISDNEEILTPPKRRRPRLTEIKGIDLGEESSSEKDHNEDELISDEEPHEFDDFIINDEDKDEVDQEEEFDDSDKEELEEESDPEVDDSEEESEYDPNDPESYRREMDEINMKGNKTIIFFLSNNGDFNNPLNMNRSFDSNLDEEERTQPPFNLIKKRKHIKSAKKPIKRIKTDIKKPIKTLDDLIKLTESYPNKPNLEYAFDVEQAEALKAPLEELKNMVGLQSLKEQIVDQVMFLLSGLRDRNQMLHTVITGSPGCGKTTCGLILSKVYQALGYSNGKFRIVKRSDLVGEYLGHTAAKTQRVIDSVRGGVLFIDEAYSLGNGEGRDSFAKEAIDTLNQNLSMDDKEKGEFICIIAGYKNELDSCFFSMNPGLARRFTFRYEIMDYSPDQLHKIYLKKLELSGWSCDPIPDSFFQQNHKSFKNKGGDMEVLSQKAKIAYSRRIFGYHQKKPKHLSMEDVKEGLRLFLTTEMTKSDVDNVFEEQIRPTMFI